MIAHGSGPYFPPPDLRTGCSGLVSLPDLSGLAQLQVEGLPENLQLWRASGYKAFSLYNEA